MEIKEIPVSIVKIEKIFHISDVHIRNLKRHSEYKDVFDRLYKYIQANKTESSVIITTGDIVHSKTDMSPELVSMVQSFYRNLSKLCLTIAITGNHDCNLNNRTRLDALEPIIQALDSNNIIYLKESGVYKISNIHFTVMSVFDQPKDFIRANAFDGEYKVALHHGAVDSAVTDTGHLLQNQHVPITIFDGYDITLLGDIHVPNQILQSYSYKGNIKKPEIRYPGSLSQQNFGEALTHGILVWDINSRTAEFIEIPNDYCYYTLKIVKGKYIEIPKELKSKTIRLRLKVQDTSPAEIKSILNKLHKKYTITETITQRIKDFNSLKLGDKINIGDVRDVEYQNKLITQYLNELHPHLDNLLLDGVRHINRKVNSLLPKSEITRNIVWIPKKFEYSNMFSYGDGNVIDFEKMKGVYGIFAANASGKSTFLDALSFCIFDKCSRTSKAINVLNNKSSSFYCKFSFMLDDKLYFIERRGKSVRGGHIRVDVDFYTVNEFGERHSLNGKERSDTNANIRSYVGTYEDFILTALSVQNNNTGFIDMPQRERKDLLSQFLDTNVFESLFITGTEDCKELYALLKEHQKSNYEENILESTKLVDKLTKEHEDNELTLSKINDNINDVEHEILELTKQIVPVDQQIIDINNLKQIRLGLESSLKTKKEELVIIKDELDILKDKITTNEIKRDSYDISHIKKKISEREELIASELSLTNSLSMLTVELQHKRDKMVKLQGLKYDENCNFCMNNIFVKDAIQTKKSIHDDELNVQVATTKLESLRGSITNLLSYVTDYDDYKRTNDLVRDLYITKGSKTSKYHHVQSDISSINSLLSTTDLKIDEYYKQENHIKNNTRIGLEIAQIRSKLSALKQDKANIETQIKHLYAQIQINKNTIDLAAKSLVKFKELEKEYKYYQYYLDAVQRDGVPYHLITLALPQIEHEINNILAQLVEFSILMETDGKNINTYIVYDNDNFWPIELTSGMEKFISSLAIRSALISITSLPKPNFMAIDEGLGNLDYSNLHSFGLLLEYLKTQFEFIMMISHVETARDMVDYCIEIHKENGKSKIIHE